MILTSPGNRILVAAEKQELKSELQYTETKDESKQAAEPYKDSLFQVFLYSVHKSEKLMGVPLGN